MADRRGWLTDWRVSQASVTVTLFGFWWLVDLAYELGTGRYGRELSRLETEHPDVGHGQTVAIGVIALVLAIGLISAAVVLAWRGGRSRRARIACCACVLLVLLGGLDYAIHHPGRLAGWLRLARDLVTFGVLLLGAENGW